MATGVSDGGAGGPLFAGVGALCEAAVRSSGSDGAAVAVFAPSRARDLVYATDALAQQIDDLQFTLGEGPCLDAHRLESPELCPRLDTETQVNRWPAFCAGATELGVGAVFALPVLSPKRVLGVLELYRRTTGDLAQGQRDSATESAIAIADALLANWHDHLSGAIDAVATIEAASADPGDPLASGHPFSRARVYIASGMVAVQLGVSADESLDRLRAYTFAQGRPIADISADIVAKLLSLQGLRDAWDDR